MEHKKIIFVSSNLNKFAEYCFLLTPYIKVEHFDISLPEPQIENLNELGLYKLEAAKEAFLKTTIDAQGIFIEDTALYFSQWKNFPGVFIKWMLKSLGVTGIYDSLHLFDKSAKAECILSFFHKPTNKNYFFSGSIEGTITSPKGANKFGWDSLFIPKNYHKTFAEMAPTEKNKISHRFLATQKFINFLKLN